MAAFEAWLVFLILVVNVVGELQRKRTLAASRGFLAAARLSCCIFFYSCDICCSCVFHLYFTELIMMRCAILTCLELCMSLSWAIRYDTIGEFNVDSKAEYTA